MSIAQAVASVSLAAPQWHKNMVIFPLVGEDDSPAKYLMLDEALDQKKALVTEVSQVGSVPTLAFTNESDQPILLVEGDELRGAKQNRVLNLTIFVGGGVKIDIPVSCVEQGRWGYKGSTFSKGETFFAKGRAANYNSVTESLRSSNSTRGNQQQVWASVGQKLQETHTVSASSAMSDSYEKMSADISEYEGAFKPVANQRGAVVCIDGKPVGMELFDSEAAFKKFLGKLVRSYAMDASTTNGSKGNPKDLDEAVRTFLGLLSAVSGDTFSTVGEGESLRWSDKGLNGGARVVNGKVVHMASFTL